MEAAQNQLQQKRSHTKVKPEIFCYHCGSREHRKNGTNKGSGTQIYRCKDCDKDFTPGSNKQTLIVVDPKAEYEKDCWDCRRLGLSPGMQARENYRLNFEAIAQPWLKTASKKFVKSCLARLAFSSCQAKLYSLRMLSQFLTASYPEIKPAEIDRDIIIEFRVSLYARGISDHTKHGVMVDLRAFMDACYQNDWLPVIRYLVRSEDMVRPPRRKPRYIPEEVMRQLNEHIDELSPPMMRMTLVIQECGMRISELVELPFDCLLQDKAGDWFMRYYQSKMKKEITIPISREVVRVVQEQQRYIRKFLGSDFDYLFCANSGVQAPKFNPVPRIMTRKILPRQLNKLAAKHNICDCNGKQWHFQTHQFRHTVGTRMINNGVPQHVVQRYLGHESPDMTSVYAHIHDKTMKAEIAKFQGKVVNITGQVVEPNDIQADTVELQWFKKNIQAQALPNGSCALPTISKGCPHANACLTCTHFRTSTEYLPEHEKELAKTERLIEKAKANGWQRQVEMNETVAKNLTAIIQGLEVASNE